MLSKASLNNIALSLIAIVFATGCMKQKSALSEASGVAAEAIGCDHMQSKIFDSMYTYLDQEKLTPDLLDLESELSRRIDDVAKNQKIQDLEKISELKTEFYKIFKIMIEDSRSAKNIKSTKDHLQTLIELEMQNTTTSENIKLNSKLSKQFSKVSELANALNMECSTATTNRPDTSAVPAAAVNAQSRMIAGQNNVFSTSYQSCQALEVPEINAQTPDVVGITRVGTHSDGVGGIRDITHLTAVQNTHPYIRVAGNGQGGCFNVRNQPLIYDYGGEPSVLNNTINFFKNVGTGSKTTLGIDCSAYISSAIAAAGFRYKPGVENKAIFIRQSSANFINAKNSGFACFDNITLTNSSSIKPGDIAAVRGHVVMIDKIGSDPFGLKKLTTASQCATIDIKNFDFTISQSSPVKNGIGIDKMVAKDYLAEQSETGKMRVLFTSMAKSACTAYFKNVSQKPISSDWGIIRHNGKPECLAPRIQMMNQSCVSQCQM